MIRSVNIFKSTDVEFPIRIEFWDTDKLVNKFEVESITGIMARLIRSFIKGENVIFNS